MLFLLNAAGSVSPALAHGSGPEIPWLRIALALGLCLALAAAAVWALRMRYGLSAMPHGLRPFAALNPPEEAIKQDRLQLVDRLAISPGHQLILVRLGTRRYLLHLSPTGATSIDCIAEDQGQE